MMKQEDLLKRLKEHRPICVNYGKSTIDPTKDVKEYAYWDDKANAYVSDTGIWSAKLLIEILKGEVEDTTLESGD